MSAAPSDLLWCSFKLRPSSPWLKTLLVLDGVYRRSTPRAPEFVKAPALIDETLQTMVHKIVTRLMNLPTRRGVWVEERGWTSLTDDDVDSEEARSLRPLTASACTYPIAFGLSAGQTVLTLQGL